MTNIQKMLEENADFFDAIEYAANTAVHKVGYNKEYEFLPDLIVTYELLDHGPERLYSGQYAHNNKEEYGENIDPTTDLSITEDERFRELEEAYRVITVCCGGEIVFRMEGKCGLQMSRYAKGEWEKQLVEIWQNQCEANKPFC